MRMGQLIGLCKMYAKEGSSIWDQLDDTLEGRDFEELNPNALKIIHQFFERAARADVDGAEDMAECILDYLNSRQNT